MAAELHIENLGLLADIPSVVVSVMAYVLVCIYS